MAGLTPKKKRFADVYCGNGTEAARMAGYKGSDNTLAKQAQKLLREPAVLAVIRAREARESRPAVATRQERQEFWTNILRDTQTDLPQRLRASELLGKSEADFAERHLVSGLTLEELVLGPKKTTGSAVPTQTEPTQPEQGETDGAGKRDDGQGNV